MTESTVKNTVFHYTAPKTLALAEEPLGAPKPGEVQCKTLCSLVSIGTEMICFAREVQEGSHWDNWVQYPFEPGYLSVGEITEVNDDSGEFKVGQRVCSYAAHRQYFNDKASNLFPVPEDIKSDQAAWFGLNNIVQNGIRHVEPRFGETAVVVGLGPLGQVAVRLLANIGLKHLIVVEPSQFRCDLARPHASHVVCDTADKAKSLVMELTNGNGADMVFDMTGHPKAFNISQTLLRPLGRLGLIGDVPDPSAQNLCSDVIRNSISIIASHAIAPPQTGNNHYYWGKEEMTDYFFELIRSKRFNVDELNTRVLDPNAAPEFYSHLYGNREKEVGVIVDWANFEGIKAEQQELAHA